MSPTFYPTQCRFLKDSSGDRGLFADAIGGEDGGARAVEFDTVERFDPASGKWTLVASMTLPRAQVDRQTPPHVVFGR